MADTKEVTRLRDLRQSSRDLFLFDPNVIKIEDGHNPRNYELPENRAHLDELKDSIKEQGVLQPILVRYDKGTKEAILVDGECRLRAVLELIADGVEIVSIPGIQVSGTNEIERLIIAITANTGKPLSKWEAGTAFQRFVKFGMEPAAIATKLGFSLRYITDSLELADAPQAVKKLLSEQAITPSLALEHLRKNGSSAVESLKAKIAETKAKGKKSIATTERKSPGINVRNLVASLLSDVTEEDITNTEFEYIEVNRKRLLKLWRIVN